MTTQNQPIIFGSLQDAMKIVEKMESDRRMDTSDKAILRQLMKVFKEADERYREDFERWAENQGIAQIQSFDDLVNF